jgi:1,6-anhydro-N-acetylmuramate kinase
MSARQKKLLGRLRKGMRKTKEILEPLTPEQWDTVLYPEPYPWTVRDLLAHFLSAEEGLRRIGQDIAAGGRGAPEGLDYNHYNAEEQERLAGIPAEELLADLHTARQETIAWVEGLADEDLDREGYHPALGKIDLETLINAIYGHQLMHMRDAMAVLG